MFNFSQLKSLTIPEGNVTQIKVGDSVLWTKPKKPIGKLKVGGSIWFKVGGVDTEFTIVQQGLPTDASGTASTLYDKSCKGTWLLMKSIAKTDQLNANNVNNYSKGYLHTYLNTISDINALSKLYFLDFLEENVRNAIIEQNAKIPYVAGNGKGSVSSGANGLSVKCFLLSAKEVGFSNAPNGDDLHNDGVLLDYFKTDATTKRATSMNWWTRSPAKGWTDMMIMSYENGTVGVINSNLFAGIRPAFILPSDFDTTDYTVSVQ